MRADFKRAEFMNESSCRPALFLSSSHDHRADCSSASGGFLFSSFSTDRYGLVRSNTILQHHAASADVKAMRCFESKTEWTGCWLFGSDKSDLSDVSDARQNRQCGIRRHKGTGQQQKNTAVRRKTTLPIACCASAQRQAQPPNNAESGALSRRYPQVLQARSEGIRLR